MPTPPLPGRARASIIAAVFLALVATACGNAPDEGGPGGGAAGGVVDVDGSSTVAPLTDAIAEEYSAGGSDVRVNVGVSGTGGGFERFCAGETDISNASRAIKEEEAQACRDSGVDFIEVRVGTDALSVVTSPDTDWVECLTFEELSRIWGEEAAAETWGDVNPEFPDEELRIFAPGADSGTYDFFTEEVLGDEGSPRQDYNASEDDNIIAQGVQGTVGSWGFFGFAYFQENSDTIKALEVDAGDGCVPPSVETAMDGSYPLARPLYIYVKRDALQREAVADFVRFYLENVDAVIEDVGYIPAPAEDLDAAAREVEDAVGAEG